MADGVCDGGEEVDVPPMTVGVCVVIGVSECSDRDGEFDVWNTAVGVCECRDPDGEFDAGKTAVGVCDEEKAVGEEMCPTAVGREMCPVTTGVGESGMSEDVTLPVSENSYLHYVCMYVCMHSCKCAVYVQVLVRM
jgi:hypothetical protein